jgi:hypothetical protein
MTLLGVGCHFQVEEGDSEMRVSFWLTRQRAVMNVPVSRTVGRLHTR